MHSIYLDNNASTPVLEAVWEAMRPHLAAADLYRRLEGFKDGTTAPRLAEVTAAFRRGAPRRKASGVRRKSSKQREEQAHSTTRFKFGTAALKRDAAKRLRSLKRD